MWMSSADAKEESINCPCCIAAWGGQVDGVGKWIEIYTCTMHGLTLTCGSVIGYGPDWAESQKVTFLIKDKLSQKSSKNSH